MDCRTAERLISLQSDGLTIEESSELAMHTAGCQACAREQQLQQRLSMTLKDIGKFELKAPAGLNNSVINKLKQERRSLLPFIPANWRKTAAAAAALLLITGSSAGVTAGIWRMAVGGKTVVLETPSPVASVGVNDMYTSSGDPGEGTGPGSGPADSAGAPQVAVLPGEAPGDNAGTKGNEEGLMGTVPTTVVHGDTADNPVAAGGATAMLSSGMKVTSTVLKLAVDDMASARAKAVSIAAGFGVANQVFPEQSSGRQILVMRMTIASSQASGLISGLGQLGTVLDRQDESRDLSSLYNETMVEYHDLLAKQGTVQDPEEQRKLGAQIASYKQQLDAWNDEAGKRVVVVWLESD